VSRGEAVKRKSEGQAAVAAAAPPPQLARAAELRITPVANRHRRMDCSL
jgi:hypothetical protein